MRRNCHLGFVVGQVDGLLPTATSDAGPVLLFDEEQRRRRAPL
jgi:hypothetical protein